MHKHFKIGVQPSGKATVFGTVTRRFEPYHSNFHRKDEITNIYVTLFLWRTSSNGRTSVCGTENRGSIPRVRLFSFTVGKNAKAEDTLVLHNTEKLCFTSFFKLSASCYAIRYEPLTQVVEYLTFNQEVASSNLAWLIDTVLISSIQLCQN